MHVGVNTLFLIPREVGGTEIYVRSLLPSLQAIDANLRITVFTNRENHKSFDHFDRVLIDVAATSRPQRIIAEQWALPRAAARAKIDVLYSPGYTAPLRAPCPQVVTIHDTQFLDFPEDFPWLSRMAQRAIVGGAARRANAITTVSEFSRGRIAERFRVPREKIVVAHSALSGLFAQPQPCALPKPFLLYIANTYPHKNATRLVRAFDRIEERIPHTLVICGQPREGEPPPHPRVKRIHYIAYEELIGMVQAADLMVFPSLYEGFGRPVVEAQEAGTRVIASRSAAIPEIGGDGATYFDGESEGSIAQAILDAFSESEERRTEFIARGRENAKRFTWDECAKRTLEAFTRARGVNL
ncbi:MAG: glycosyltransferase family 4 protein [Candidatus Hydrogenedentes bacterium]|nr:glycosyltransferase family 4 protein [Candidatus Hydrogenedentota bacterium]